MSSRGTSHAGGGPSRVMHNNRMANKKGSSAVYKQEKVPNKLIRDQRPRVNEAEIKMQLQEQELLVKDAQEKKKARIEETHYSIPDVEQNGNLLEQAYVRTHTKHAVLVNEMKTRSKATEGGEEVEHVSLK